MSENRRKFLKSSAIGALGVGLLGNHACTNDPKAATAAGITALGKDTINIGVVGTGSRGKWLMKLMQDIPQLKINAICDILPKRLEEAKNLASKGATVYKDYEQLMNDSSVDAILNTTPLHLHTPVNIAALQAGKHVYCEKTMTYSIEETPGLVDLIKNTPVVFQVGYQHRYNPLYQKVKQLIQNNELGYISHIECYWNRNGDWRRKVEDPANEKIINWRLYREFSGGLMAELSSHQMDIVNWMVEDNPESVMGYGGIDFWKDGRETYDNAHVLFAYPGGMKVDYKCLTTNRREGFQFNIYGKEASIQILGSNGHEAFIYSENRDYKKAEAIEEETDGVSAATEKAWAIGEPVPIKVPDAPDSDVTKEALKGFADCILTGKQPVAGYETGANSSMMVHLANNAMREQKILPWKSDYNYLKFT